MRFRSAVEHAQRAVSIRSGQKWSYPGRGVPLTAARRLGSMLKMECAFGRNFITSLDHVVDVQGKMRERALHFEHAAQAASGRERATTGRIRPFLAGSGQLRAWSMRNSRSAPRGRACAASNRAFLTTICSAVPRRCSRVPGCGACGRHSANHGACWQGRAFDILSDRSARRQHHVSRVTCTS